MSLAYTVPTPGSTLNSVADPEVATALNTILTWANGNIQGSDLSPNAAIAYSQIAALVWYPLTLPTGITTGTGPLQAAASLAGTGTLGVIRLRGFLLNNTGSAFPEPSTTLATMPSAAPGPGSPICFPVAVTISGNAGGASQNVIQFSGNSISLQQATLANGSQVWLDGITYVR